MGDKKRKEKKGTFLSGWVASSRNKEDRRARMVGLSLRWFIPPTTAEPSAVRSNPPVISVEWRNSEVRPPRNCRTAATRLRGERPDPLLEAAVRAAFLRFQESLRPDPQFIDPYSSCLLSSTVSHHDVESKYSPSPCQYRLATKFIDDNLLSMLGTTEDLRQMVWTPGLTG